MDLPAPLNSADKHSHNGEHNKETEHENNSNRAAWTEPQRVFLVSLLVEFNKPVHRQDNGWTQGAWAEMVERFSQRFPAARFNKAQIKDQQQHLRKRLQSLQRVLSMSGVEWNDDLKQIDFQDATVEEALMNDKEVCQWHGKPFPYYNDLCNLFKGEHNKEIKKENDSNRAAWTEPQRVFLVSLLVEFNTPEHRQDNGWTQGAWIEMVERFSQRFPSARFNKAQIKDQQQQLRRRLQSLQRVLSMSGVGWNDDLKQIDFQDATAEEALMNNKVRQWHGKPFPYYHDLCNLFKDFHSTRRKGSKKIRNHENGEMELNSPSLTTTPPMGSPQVDMENELMSTPNRQSIIDIEPDFPYTVELPCTHPQTFTHDTLSSKVNKMKKRKVIGKLHDGDMPYNREETRLICETMEKNPLRSIDHSEIFSINAAMVAFQELEGFDVVDLYVASKMFMADAGVREAFLSCFRKNRIGWMRLMIDQYKAKQRK